MKTIYKYPLTLESFTEVAMPVEAEILDIQMQYDVICIWALVDPENRLVTRKFRIFGTGHPIEMKDLDSLVYLKTVKTRTELFIWHVFEVKNEKDRIRSRHR